MTTTNALMSIGYLSSWLQAPPAKITAAAQSAGIAPTITINGVAHYSEEQGEQIRDALRPRETR